MSRIFTVNFEFRRRIYSALVTMRETDDRLDFHIQLDNFFLRQMLPPGRVQYQGSEGYKGLADFDSSLSCQLVQCIASVIEEHIQTDALLVE